MLGLYVVIAVVVLGLIIGISTSVIFEKSLVRQKREEEDARIKEELSKQEQKRAPRMEEEKQTTAQNDDEEKLKWWYANMNINLDEGAVECGFNMLQLYFASVNGTSKPFKKKLNQLTRLNRYYK